MLCVRVCVYLFSVTLLRSGLKVRKKNNGKITVLPKWFFVFLVLSKCPYPGGHSRLSLYVSVAPTLYQCRHKYPEVAVALLICHTPRIQIADAMCYLFCLFTFGCSSMEGEAKGRREGRKEGGKEGEREGRRAWIRFSKTYAYHEPKKTKKKNKKTTKPSICRCSLDLIDYWYLGREAVGVLVYMWMPNGNAKISPSFPSSHKSLPTKQHHSNQKVFQKGNMREGEGRDDMSDDVRIIKAQSVYPRIGRFHLIESSNSWSVPSIDFSPVIVKVLFDLWLALTFLHIECQSQNWIETFWKHNFPIVFLIKNKVKIVHNQSIFT